MIRCLLYDPEKTELKQGGRELVEQWSATDPSIIWIDLEGEPETTSLEIFKRFDIHPLAIEDALRKRRPPKFETFETFSFMLLRGLDADTTGIDFGVIQLSIFFGERFLITYHVRRSVSTNRIFEEAENQAFSRLRSGPRSLALDIANYLTRRYIDILLDLEPRLDDIEQEVFAAPNDDHLSELTGYKSRLRDIGRIGRYHLQVVNGFRRMQRALDDDSYDHEMTDVYEQVERAVSLADLYYETAKDLTDGYLALSAHRLNRVMQVLTVITVIFVPLTFIAGIYGMNFTNMPELATDWGYFVVVSFMITIGIALITYFHRKDWI